jgi:hypothetical protein
MMGGLPPGWGAPGSVRADQKPVKDCKIASRTERAKLEGAEPLAHEAQGFFPLLG